MEMNFTAEEELCISSSLENLSTVEDYVDAVCKRNAISEDHYGNIIIAITEGVNNAIAHGNKKDTQKSVYIRINNSSDGLTCEIEDEGAGFDFENLPDPTAPENIEMEHGRGVFLMKALADSIEFEKKGALVRLTFELND
jgi:serine/threonine-protein kinase RsbW